MKQEPLISIMMPVYNGYPLIKASVASLQRQNYSNWECIIVDDGSTDATSEYIDSIDDSRFVVYHFEKNSGRAVARQKALDLCNGKYIGMLDAEDLVHPDKFKKQVEYLEQHEDCSLISSALCSFGIRNNILLVRGPRKSGEHIFNGNDFPIHAASLYRSEIAKKCVYNPLLKLGEDQDFLEKYLSFNSRYYEFADILYFYSELDSVTKDKIIKNYYLYIIKYFKQKKYKKSFVFFLKFIYGKIVFPFMGIDKILYKRGREATKIERKDFVKYCKSVIDVILTDAKQ